MKNVMKHVIQMISCFYLSLLLLLLLLLFSNKGFSFTCNDKMSDYDLNDVFQKVTSKPYKSKCYKKNPKVEDLMDELNDEIIEEILSSKEWDKEIIEDSCKEETQKILSQFSIDINNIKCSDYTPLPCKCINIKCSNKKKFNICFDLHGNYLQGSISSKINPTTYPELSCFIHQTDSFTFNNIIKQGTLNSSYRASRVQTKNNDLEKSDVLGVHTQAVGINNKKLKATLSSKSDDVQVILAPEFIRSIKHQWRILEKSKDPKESWKNQNENERNNLMNNLLKKNTSSNIQSHWGTIPLKNTVHALICSTPTCYKNITNKDPLKNIKTLECKNIENQCIPVIYAPYENLKFLIPILQKYNIADQHGCLRGKPSFNNLHAPKHKSIFSKIKKNFNKNNKNNNNNNRSSDINIKITPNLQQLELIKKFKDKK
ncbi:MAG: hypothetical protein HQK49_13875 [Oligoflexia bacterium]|nr:hypothetical protein [Oligoflexia bacterium]